MAGDNKTIGRFHLDGIPPAPRGMPQIEVTFDIDANGILNVSAKDKGTGKQQSIRIEASTGLSDEEIERMKEEAKSHEAEDKSKRERVDKLNTADSLIFQTEKQLKEFGDKLPADKKGPIEKALEELKAAHKSQDIEAIDKATAQLNDVWQKASEDLYKASQGAGAGADAGAGPNPGSEPNQGAGEQQADNGKKKSDSKGGDDEVTDVDFEEVK
jgi:molecular chaperone DnaK